MQPSQLFPVCSHFECEIDLKLETCPCLSFHYEGLFFLSYFLAFASVLPSSNEAASARTNPPPGLEEAGRTHKHSDRAFASDFLPRCCWVGVSIIIIFNAVYFHPQPVSRAFPVHWIPTVYCVPGVPFRGVSFSALPSRSPFPLQTYRLRYGLSREQHR